MAEDRAHDSRRVFNGYTDTHKSSSVSRALVPTTPADNTYFSSKGVGLSGKGKAKDVAEHLGKINKDVIKDAQGEAQQHKEMNRY